MSNLKVIENSAIQLEIDALAYKDLAAKIRFLGEQLKPIKERLEAAAAAAPEGKIVTEKFQILLSLGQRENFDKKAAIAALGRDKLAPFMSTTAFTQLRVS